MNKRNEAYSDWSTLLLFLLSIAYDPEGFQKLDRTQNNVMNNNRRQRMRGRPRLTVGRAEQLALLLPKNVDGDGRRRRLPDGCSQPGKTEPCR